MARKVSPYAKIVGNLVEVPADAPKQFWAKEVTLAKLLCEKYGLEQVQAYTPSSKSPSIAYLIAADSDLGYRIERNWKLKNLVIPERPVVVLGEKCGEDSNVKLPVTTLKSWLSPSKL